MTARVGRRSTFLFYGEDARGVYSFWQAVEPLAEPRALFVPGETVEEALAALAEALPTPIGEEDVAAASARMARTGAFRAPSTERALARRLGRLLIDDTLPAALARARDENGERPLLRILPAPSCAMVPWELLVVGDGAGGETRLIDLADIVYDPPPGLYGGRAREPQAWTSATGAPRVCVIDPVVPDGSFGAVMTDGQIERFQRRLAAHDRGRDEHDMSRWQLSRHLRAEPAPDRLLYIGHVVGSPSLAGATSLVLSDAASTYGVVPASGSMRPLSAFDLIEGTAYAMHRAADADPADAGPVDVPARGSDLWPMPPRVALIGCASGGDVTFAEPFGLVIACLHSGAETVTAARWTLPTDRAFRDRDELLAGDPEPLWELAAAVDDAHSSPDPVHALAEWQRARLRAWESDPDAPLHASPLTWGAVTTFVAPSKPLVPLSRDEREWLSPSRGAGATP